MSKDRNFRGCWACRYKKRKCDELTPICSLCLKHGGECCYDIRLSWLPENMHIVENDQLKVTSQPFKTKMSKERFKEMTELKCSSHTLERESFTISARRFKVYDNTISCIHKDRHGKKIYDWRWVDDRMSFLLAELESRTSAQSVLETTNCGPFSIFGLYNDVSSKTTNHRAKAKYTSNHKAGHEISMFFSNNWNDLIAQAGDNYSLHDKDFLRIFKKSLQSVVFDSSFPKAVIKTCFNTNYWAGLLSKFSKRFQSAIVFLLYLQNVEGYQLMIQRWIKAQFEIEDLDIPILVHLSHVSGSDRQMMQHIRGLLESHQPYSLVHEIVVDRLKTQLSSDLFCYPSPQSSTDFNEIIGIGWDINDNYMKLEVM